MLVIDSFEKLNALLKLLWAVKFDMPTEESVDFISSPYIAEIFQQTYLATIELLRKEYREGDAFKLEDELNGSHTFEIKAVEKHIEFLYEQWIKWGLERKRTFVKLLLSPYIVSEEAIEEIIQKHS